MVHSMIFVVYEFLGLVILIGCTFEGKSVYTVGFVYPCECLCPTGRRIGA